MSAPKSGASGASTSIGDVPLADLMRELAAARLSCELARQRFARSQWSGAATNAQGTSAQRSEFDRYLARAESMVDALEQTLAKDVNAGRVTTDAESAASTRSHVAWAIRQCQDAEAVLDL